MAVARTSPRAADSTDRIAADFLRIDSEVALTFSGIALMAIDEVTRRRTTMAARRAYDTIAGLRWNIELTEAERQKLDKRRLPIELQSLGQIL